MFNQLIKRQYHLKIHLNAPLYQERLEYIQYWANLGRSKHTLKAAASYLLRIVEFLQLDKRKMLTYEDIEKAAILWAQHQSNHPMKRAFSKSGNERFTWYAIHWLKRLNRLEASPEEKIPLFNEIFERRKALKRHMIGPLLQERLKYLQYWSDNGAAANTLKGISQYLLIVIKCLNLNKLRMISHNEVENAANLWASQKHFKRKSEYSKTAKARFVHNALGWLEMLGCLKKTDQKPIPSEEYLQKYIEHIPVPL